MFDVLRAFMTWLHVASAITLVGGLLYARLVVTPASSLLGAESRDALSEDLALRYRPFVYAAIMGLVISGLYKLMMAPGHTFRYDILLALKVLLALHVFAVSLLVAQKHVERRARMMAGAIVSGLIVIAIASYLRLIY
jgi:uncharacterized membrane protein